MAINNQAIKTQVSNLIDQTKILEPDAAKQAFAEGLANIIEAAIKSATVTVNAGILVTTSGGSGATSSVGTGSLS